MTHKNVKFGTLEGSSEALDAAINEALAEAGVSLNEIDAICGFAMVTILLIMKN